MRGALLTILAGAVLAVVPAVTPAHSASAAAERRPGYRGPIGTLEQGQYVCELPGRADGPRGIVQPEAGFRIVSASRYVSDQGTGTYLRRGDVMILSSGPRRGERYRVVSPGFLRKLDEDRASRLRCVRRGR